MKTRLQFPLLMLLGLATAAQERQASSHGFVHSGDLFGTRNFIENKGQFTNPVQGADPVLFIYDHGGDKIYFTSRGVIYELNELKPLSEEEFERQEQSGKEPNRKRTHV